MVTIRQEQPDDFQAVYEVNTLAFGQENEAKLVELLRRSEAFVPDNVFMALELIAEGLKDTRGVVRYPEEFGVV